MSTRTLETDYLVVGCGAAGMAFTDALISASPAADVVMVDRRHAPGGHWNDAYPFVRLHQPSAYYGVSSLPLGSETIEQTGPNRGFYERAGAAEIVGYYDRVMQQRLLASGRVRWFAMSDFIAPNRIVSRLDGEAHEVKVRKRLVDARYLEGAVPATSAPPFEVAPEARCVPVGELSRLGEPPEGYVVIGAGKTALDACTWLLDQDVAPERIRWVKPREAWLLNRTYAQGGELVGTLLEGLGLQLEAAAKAATVPELFERLEAAKQWMRVDRSLAPTMYRGPTVSEGELQQLRRIEGVVRLGRVQRIERDRIVLDSGIVPTSPGHLHVHCAAGGLGSAPAVPVFTADRITLQSIRIGLLPFASALIAYVEATRDELDRKNRLCPPCPQPNVPLDWLGGTLNSLQAEFLWSKEPDLIDWLDGCRLNTSRGLRQRRSDPALEAHWLRYGSNVAPAVANLKRLLAASPGAR